MRAGCAASPALIAVLMQCGCETLQHYFTTFAPWRLTSSKEPLTLFKGFKVVRGVCRILLGYYAGTDHATRPRDRSRLVSLIGERRHCISLFEAAFDNRSKAVRGGHFFYGISLGKLLHTDLSFSGISQSTPPGRHIKQQSHQQM